MNKLGSDKIRKATRITNKRSYFPKRVTDQYYIGNHKSIKVTIFEFFFSLKNFLQKF